MGEEERMRCIMEVVLDKCSKKDSSNFFQQPVTETLVRGRAGAADGDGWVLAGCSHGRLGLVCVDWGPV